VVVPGPPPPPVSQTTAPLGRTVQDPSADAAPEGAVMTWSANPTAITRAPPIEGKARLLK
jgi:hypothetical protein